jgi:hypothetical protein
VARVYEQKAFLEGNPDFWNFQRSILEKDLGLGGEWNELKNRFESGSACSKERNRCIAIGS